MITPCFSNRIEIPRGSVPDYIFEMLMDEVGTRKTKRHHVPQIILMPNSNTLRKFRTWMHWHHNPETFEQRMDRFESEAWSLMAALSPNQELARAYVRRSQRMAWSARI